MFYGGSILEMGTQWVCGGVEQIAYPFTRGVWPVVVGTVEHGALNSPAVHSRIVLAHFSLKVSLLSAPYTMEMRLKA